MKVYYKNNLKQAYLVVKCEERQEEDFENAMLQANLVPGLLRTRVNYGDEGSEYCYDISGKISLKARHEKQKLTCEDIKKLVNALLLAISQVQQYMLEEGGILLHPEYIFWEKEEYRFCYYPPQHRQIKETFHELTEYFVREVDYGDMEGVQLAYTLHKMTMEEHYSVEKIMSEMAAEGISPARYDKPADEGREGLAADEIREEPEPMETEKRKGFPNPLRRIFERSREEKWGGWS